MTTVLNTSFLEKSDADKDIWINENSPGVTYNHAQRRAIRLFLSRNNIVISGPPGTGKTFVSNQCFKLYKILYPDNNFERTATTGMASTHISIDSTQGKTFYRWLHSGSDSLRSHTEHFKSRLSSDTSKLALVGTQALQIDEASMLNETAYGFVEQVARRARNNRSHMGGIQCLLSGDIMQLAVIDPPQGPGAQRDIPVPVTGILENIPGEYEVVILTELVRSSTDKLHQALLKALVQKDPNTRKRALHILNSLCYHEYLTSFNGVVDDARERGATIITPSNERVRCYVAIEEVGLKKKYPEGPTKISRARKLHNWDSLSTKAKKILENEEGLEREEKWIQDMNTFEMELHLYPGQNVMIRRNSDEYKNGEVSRFLEVVIEESVTKIRVERYSDKKILIIDPIEHTSEYVITVGYEQIPVVRNSASSIHKIQGSTLPNGVIFDPYKIEFFGKHIARMLYVACSRTTDLKSIVLTDKIDVNLIVLPEVQAELENIWALGYMADYPTISLLELETIYKDYCNTK